MLDLNFYQTKEERIDYLNKMIENFYYKIENKTMKRREMIIFVLCIRRRKMEAEF